MNYLPVHNFNFSFFAFLQISKDKPVYDNKLILLKFLSDFIVQDFLHIVLCISVLNKSDNTF